MKKLVALSIALILLLGLAAAAQSEDTPVISLGVAASAMVEDWNTNRMTLLIEETLGVDLTFMEFPSDQNERLQKLELMVMAGGNDLPDVLMFGLNMATQAQYGAMGILKDLTPYYNGETDHYLSEAAPKTFFGTKEELLKYITCYDGKIYAVPNLNEAINNIYSVCRMNIYQPWLDALGLQRPTTTEEFADVLRAFKQQDPNGNGQADEIPYMGYQGNVRGGLVYPLMNPFVYTQDNYYMVEDGVVSFVANTDGWREGLLWVRSLFDEELLSPLTFTQDQAQFTAQLSGEETIIGVHGRFSSSNMATTDERRIEYFIVEPLEGPDGLKQTVYSPRLPASAMHITMNCQDPELAFKIGDFKISEAMSLMDYYGVEDVNWRYADENDVGHYESVGYKPYVATVGTPTWGTLQNDYWGQVGPYLYNREMSNGSIINDPLDYINSIASSIGPQIEYANMDNYLYGLIYDEAETAVVNEFQTVINDYVLEAFSRFVTRDLSIENDWDQYVDTLEAMGLEAYLGAVQSAYDRMNP